MNKAAFFWIAIILAVALNKWLLLAVAVAVLIFG